VGFEDSLGDPSDPNTPESDLRALSTSDAPLILIAVAGNPSTPLDVVKRFLAKDSISQDDSNLTLYLPASRYEAYETWDAAASNPSLPVELIEQLAESHEGLVCFGIASNPSTPDEVLFKMWDDESNGGKADEWRGDGDDKVYVRDKLLARPHLSEALMIHIAEGPNYGAPGGWVKKLLAQRKDCPTYLMEMFMRRKNEIHYLPILVALAGNPSTPEHLLAELATTGDGDVRTALAGNPSSPAEVLSQLASDSSASVQGKLVRNPSAPFQIRSGFEAHKQRISDAQNPQTPPSVLLKMALDSDEEVRSFVARNPSTPSEVLAQLALDSHW
jgi:hypothetical protein